MSEVDLVVVGRERVREGQRVVASTEAVSLALECVLVVGDVGAHSVPR